MKEKYIFQNRRLGGLIGFRRNGITLLKLFIATAKEITRTGSSTPPLSGQYYEPVLALAALYFILFLVFISRN